MRTLPLRFSNEQTHERLRLVAAELGTSMNRLVEEMVERELGALSLGLEAELDATLRRLRELRPADIEASLSRWADAEGQADPISAEMVVAEEDPFGVAAAFRR
jgi:hypothetical protein